MATGQGNCECIARLPAGEISKENCDQKILNGPKKCAYGVLSGYIMDGPRV